MLLSDFGLSVHPFGITPRLDFLYKSGAFEESMAHLVYGLDNSEAIVMITGAIGTGKTMAVQSFLSHLGDRYVSALITNTSVNGKELLKLILEDLGSPALPGADKSDLLIAFKNIMVAASKQGRRVVIVIDEAQNLSREVLEEIRLLTNLGQGEDQPVQIILVGQPELETAVQRPDLAQLKQRIRVHYKLAPLSRQELQEYVDHRMTVAGGGAGVFTGGSLDRIYALSGGVPRLVNTLCGEALLSAYVAGRRKVESRDLDDQTDPAAATEPEVLSEAVQAPTPAAERPRKEMAVRRESSNEPAQAVKPRVLRTAHLRAARRSGRGPGLVLAVVAVVAVVVALAVTGHLKQRWTQLPFSRSPDSVVEHQANMADARPTASRSATSPAGLSVSADSVKSALGDSGAAMPVNSAVDSAPAAIETAKAVSAAVPAKSVAASPVPGAGVAGAVDVENAPRATSAPDSEYYIHVSSFRTADHADSVARKFTEHGLPATVRQQVVRDVQWHRVYLGPFASHDDAVRLANRLRDEGSITYYKVIRLGADESS